MNKVKKSAGFQTRADLINRSRSITSLDNLPKAFDGMFDNLPTHVENQRTYIDFSKEKPIRKIIYTSK